MEKSNENGDTSILNKNDIGKLKNPEANELVENLEKQGFSEDEKIDALLVKISGKPRCEMSDKDYDRLDNLLDNVLGQKLNNVDKAETFTDEMIETLRNRVCALRRKNGSQKGGMSGTLIVFALATVVSAVQGLNLNAEHGLNLYRQNLLLRQGDDAFENFPDFPAENYVDFYDGNISSAPMIVRKENAVKQVKEMMERANVPLSVAEQFYYNLTPDNAQVIGNFVIVAGGALMMRYSPVAQMGQVFAVAAGAGIALNQAVAQKKVIDVGVDAVQDFGKRAAGFAKEVAPEYTKEVNKYRGKVKPVLDAIGTVYNEYKDIYNFNHINGLNKINDHLDNLKEKYTSTQINDLKRLITLSYLHKSVKAYKRFMDIALGQLLGKIDDKPSNVDLPPNAGDNIRQLKNKLDKLEEDLPGKEIQGALDDIYENVGPILKLLDEQTKSTSEINLEHITKYLDGKDEDVQKFLTPGAQTQVYNALFGDQHGQQQIFNSLFDEMKKISNEAHDNSFGKRNRWTELSILAILGASISLLTVVSLGVYTYFSRPADKKTGGKKTKKKRRKHNNKSKKIRPHKTTKRRVKKDKPKRKHK